MSSFNTKTKTLILGNKKLDKIIDSYIESDSYISYKRYITEGLKKDIEEILIPEINNLSDTVKIKLHDKSIIVEKDKDFSNSVFNKVRLSFLVPDMPDSKNFIFKDYETNPFLFCKLPYMEESGVLINKDKKYVVINSLKLDDSITYNTKVLKVVDSGHSFTITGGINPKFEMFGSGISLIDFIIMMYKYDYPVEDLGEELAYNYLTNIVNTGINNSISGTNLNYIRNKDLDLDTRDRSIRSLIGLNNEDKAIEFHFNEKIDNCYLDTVNSRYYLNKILSLNNAIGKLMSRDINTDDGETIVKKGTIVTKEIVKILHRNLIDTIYVENKPSIGGQYIGENILIGNVLPKGTPLCDEVTKYFPELDNYTIAPDNYYTDNNVPIIILKNTLITSKLLDTLLYLGKNEFYYKESLNTKKILVAKFEEEYCNNRHFPVEDLDKDMLDQVYKKPVLEEEDEENTDIEDYVDDVIFGDYVFIDKTGYINKESDKLTCHDCVALLSLYTKLNTGRYYDLFSDPDLGLRKKVDQIYNHFHTSFIQTTKKLIRMKQTTIKNYMSSSVNFKHVSKLEEIFKQFGVEFFRYLQSDLKIIDNLDITNPVSMISSLTKINTIVKDQDSIADSMRLLTMGHYGRICPYETPQSKKLGIVNNYASECIIENGKMYTSYYKLEKNKGNMYIIFNKIKMTIEEEENYRIADIRDIDYNEDGLILTKSKVLSRIPLKNSLEKMTIAYVDIEDVQYISVSYNQHISIAGTTIPFAGGNDAARTTFALAMVKQAKGLVKGEIPIINTTGFLNIINMNKYYKIFAEEDGRVLELNSSSIIVLYKNNNNIVKYEFEPMTLNFDTIVLRVVKVNKNDIIKKGQTLISSNFVKDKCMVLGVNALVGYIIDGYNYEDGIPCSERLAYKLTSYGVHTEKTPISTSQKSPAILNINYNQYIEEDNTLFRLSSKSDVDIRTIISNRILAKKSRGFIARAEFEQVDIGKEIRNTETKTVSFDKLNVSDKICNRHGNKGIACNVYKNSEMEYFENGEIIDVKINPLSIISRMNMGQTLESPLGLSCYVLGINILCSSFYSPSLSDSKMLLSYTVDLANSKEGEEDSILKRYTELPDELHMHSKKNINKIRYWRNTFNKEGKAYLINPKSGKRTLTRVNVGVNYVYKLIQEGEEKLHSRGGYITSPYVLKTDSPTKGASKEGGQRQGYMELDALAAHGASALLKEMTNERSDNAVARNNATVKSIHSGDLTYMLDENKGIRRSSEYMFEIIKALGLNSEFTEEEINLNDKESKSVYNKNTLKIAELGKSEGIPKYKSIDEDEDEIKRLMSELEKSLE